MGTGKLNAGDNATMDWHAIQGGVEILLVGSCYRNRDKLRPDGPLGCQQFPARAFLTNHDKGPKETFISDTLDYAN